MNPHILGFCGTAKNTGKTTAMKAIMDGAASRNLVVALTSIGYDGELVDHITGLPKPRIYAEPGTLVAIADSCAKGSTADIEILKQTDIVTALGKVIIGRVRKPGLILLAGPTKSKEIRMINRMIAEYGCDLILVDGALNRIAPMVEADGIIMATGASRQTDIEILTAETAAISSIYKLPLWRPQQDERTILQVGSILDEAMAEEVIAQIKAETKDIVISGIIGKMGFEALLSDALPVLQGRNLVLNDPIKLLVTGSPIDLQNWLVKLQDNQTGVLVKRQIDLRMVTINPFYPRYRYASHDYEAAYVDKEALKRSMIEALTVPVINVLDENEETLLAIALKEEKR